MAGVVKERLDDLRFLGGIYQEMENQFGAADYEEPLNAFFADLESAHLDYFLNEHAPDGSSWPPLAASTIARKGHDRILFETGKLEKQMARSGAGIREVTHRGLIFGNDLFYSIFHQEPQSGRLPKREHVGMSDELLQVVVDSVADHTVESLKSSSGGK